MGQWTGVGLQRVRRCSGEAWLFAELQARQDGRSRLNKSRLLIRQYAIALPPFHDQHQHHESAERKLHVSCGSTVWLSWLSDVHLSFGHISHVSRPRSTVLLHLLRANWHASADDCRTRHLGSQS
jgi:hypothetical protein